MQSRCCQKILNDDEVIFVPWPKIVGSLDWKAWVAEARPKAAPAPGSRCFLAPSRLLTSSTSPPTRLRSLRLSLTSLLCLLLRQSLVKAGGAPFLALPPAIVLVATAADTKTHPVRCTAPESVSPNTSFRCVIPTRSLLCFINTYHTSP